MQSYVTNHLYSGLLLFIIWMAQKKQLWSCMTKTTASLKKGKEVEDDERETGIVLQCNAYIYMAVCRRRLCRGNPSKYIFKKRRVQWQNNNNNRQHAVRRFSNSRELIINYEKSLTSFFSLRVVYLHTLSLKKIIFFIGSGKIYILKIQNLRVYAFTYYYYYSERMRHIR